MYTVFHLDIRLRDDLPDDIYKLLQRMLGDQERVAENSPLPDHPLFQTTRWNYMLCSNNVYASCVNQLMRHEFFGIRLCVQSSFKNYDNEIDKFLDWLAPYADPNMSDDTLVGYTRYEDYTYPDIIMYTQKQGTPKLYINNKLNADDQR